MLNWPRNKGIEARSQGGKWRKPPQTAGINILGIAFIVSDPQDVQ